MAESNLVAVNAKIQHTEIQAERHELISHEQLGQLYELMLLYRIADAALRREFQRKKWDMRQLPSLEHPAVCAGLFAHLRAGDCVAASRYGFAANLAAGGALPAVLRAVMTDSRRATSPRGHRKLPPDAEIAVAAGAAFAQQLAKTGSVVAAFPSHESWLKHKGPADVLRWAGEKHLPMLFVTYSHKLPEPGQSQSSYGVPRMAVDAHDVVAVYRVAQECVHRARTGVGPSWIQCVLPGISARLGPLELMQGFLEARGLFEPARKRDSAKAWRARWKESWQAALRPVLEPAASLPVSWFDAGR
jgi:TPP-dependent pyruvate/acetoin dehydrogenase alpha subunit